MPIFAPILRGTPPVPVGFNYHEVVTNWANGGTLFRNRLDETYDAAGVPIPDEICRVLEGIAPGSYVAIDIEELGYNDHPTPGNNRNQIDYVIAAKACRPDLFIGYFSAFIQSANELVHPANGPNRQAYEDNFVNNGGMDDLAAVVDFIAPRMYAVYHGPINDENQERVNGMSPSLAAFWPANSSYGFAEWRDHYDWKMGILKTRYPNMPLFPYVAPYTRTNNLAGAYAPPLDPTSLFPVPYFREMVDYVLDTADGAFFFDISAADHAQSVEDEVLDVLTSSLNPLPTLPPAIDSGIDTSDCIYGEAYPDVYPDAHPCDAFVIDPLTPNQVAAGVPFIGANGVPMVGTLEADCPSQFSVCVQYGNGNPIRGALIFASTDQAGIEIADVTISDQAGNAEFTGLETGTYYATTKINGRVIDVRTFEVTNVGS